MINHAITLAVLLVVPMSAHALMGFDVGTYGPIAAAQVIQIESGGSIKSVTSSSASSGGNSVSAGGSVTVGSAESHAETTIKSGENGGTVDVKIETEANGKRVTEELHEEYLPGEAIEIRVATSSATTADMQGTETVAPASTTDRQPQSEIHEEDAPKANRSLFKSVFLDASVLFSRFLRIFALWS